MGVAVTAAVISILWAYTRFISKGTLPAEEGKLTGFANLVYKKYLIDEIYDTIIVRPLLAISEWGYEIADRIMVDGIVVWSGRLSLITGKQLRLLQSGNIGFYLLMMVVGVISILLYLLKAL
jgi:NADH-quinone oxidoreductase subunit L